MSVSEEVSVVVPSVEECQSIVSDAHLSLNPSMNPARLAIAQFVFNHAPASNTNDSNSNWFLIDLQELLETAFKAGRETPPEPLELNETSMHKDLLRFISKANWCHDETSRALQKHSEYVVTLGQTFTATACVIVGLLTAIVTKLFAN